MFEWDHKTILLDDIKKEQFTIRSEMDLDADAVILRLPAGVQSDLNWDDICLKAEEITDQKIIWDIDFEIQPYQFCLTDQRVFQNFVCAIEHFKKHIYSQFQEKTIGVILYKGTFNFSSYFQMSETLERNLQEKFQESAETNLDWFITTFWTQAFVDYFRMLSYHVPNDLSILLCFDYPSNLMPEQSLRLFSKEYFEHFLLAIRGGEIPIDALCWERGFSTLGIIDGPAREPIEPNVGIIFPTVCFLEDLKLLNSLITYLVQNKIYFRVLEEKFITEKWNGIDFLVSFQSMQNPFIHRAIQGFLAAGGESILLEEKNFEPLEAIVNRGRGIRTPDLLVPNQSR